MSGTVLENRASEVINLATVVDSEAGARLKDQFGDGGTAHLNPDRFPRAPGELYLRRNQETVLAELLGIIATDELVEVTELELPAYRQQLAARNLMQARIAVTIGGGENSAKIKRLSDIVEECRSAGMKMLIFSYFRDVIGLVAEVVEDDVYIIHGDIQASEQARRMSAFREAQGFAALVSQITVGGQGLNLQTASVVVLMEPQFKPSTEQHAVARAHRMGQTRRVIVHRIIAQNTIDERIVCA